VSWWWCNKYTHLLVYSEEISMHHQDEKKKVLSGISFVYDRERWKQLICNDGKFFPGHTRQGLRCRMCKMNVHMDCQEKVGKCQPKTRLLRRQRSTSELETRLTQLTEQQQPGDDEQDSKISPGSGGGGGGSGGGSSESISPYISNIQGPFKSYYIWGNWFFREHLFIHQEPTTTFNKYIANEYSAHPTYTLFTQILHNL